MDAKYPRKSLEIKDNDNNRQKLKLRSNYNDIFSCLTFCNGSTFQCQINSKLDKQSTKKFLINNVEFNQSINTYIEEIIRIK